MRYNAVEFQIGPETLSRIGDDLLRRWQETVDDAQDTLTKAVSTANPVDAWSLQMEFGMRNAQRWLAWGDWEAAASEPEPASDAAPEADVPPQEAPLHEAPLQEASEPAVPEPEAAATAPEPPEAAAAVPAPPEDMPVAAPPAPAAEPSSPSAKSEPAANPEPDELQRIRGIGPAIASKLHARGITSFAQMAALDSSAVSELDTALDLKGRIERDDWIGQAQAMVAKH